MKLEKDILIPSKLEINPWIYLDILFKYEPYLRLIKSFGGYMFKQQIIKFVSKSKNQIFSDLKAMEEKNLLQSISANKNKYVLLTHTSNKFLKNKPNVRYLQKPTSTQLKNSSFLAEYVKEPKIFFDSSKPYTWFLDKYKNEIHKFNNKSAAVDMKFLNDNRELVKKIKKEEIKSLEYEDAFSLLNTSKIYFDTLENGIITFILLDFDRSKRWIYEALLDKLEPIFRNFPIYNSYNIKILTMGENRQKQLNKNISNISHKGILFLKDITIINLNIDRFFQSSVQDESFLKDIDKLEIATLQEKLKNNSSTTTM